MSKVCSKKNCQNEVKWTFKRVISIVIFIIIGLILAPTGVGLVPWGGIGIVFIMSFNKCSEHGF